MKVQQALHLIKSSPYYLELVRLSQITEEEFYNQKWNSKIFPHRWRDRQDNYCSGNRFIYTTNKLSLRVPKFYQESEITIGYMELKMSLNISLQGYEYRDTSIHATIHLEPLNFNNRNDYGDWKRIKLDPRDNLENLQQIVKNHLSKFFYLDGLIQYLQLRKGYNKSFILTIFKNYLRKRMFLDFPELDHQLIQRKITKRFNIESHVDLEKTIPIVNNIGFREELTKIYAFDTSICSYFDGDIDELEQELNDLNPYKPNVIYS